MKIAIFVCLALDILISSCSSDVKLRKEVFDKVEAGMTIKEVKDILGEPADIRETIDSNVNYFYYIHDNLLRKDYAVVEFDKEGMMCFKFYGNPD